MAEPTEPAASRPEPKADGIPLAFYRAAFDHSSEAIAIAQDGVIKVANAACARLSGYPVERLVGTPFLDLLHPEDRPRAVWAYQLRLTGDTADRTMLSRVLRADGGEVRLEAHSIPTEWEGRPAVMVFFADVSQREAARAAAAETGRLLERIAELAPYFIFIFDYEQGRDVYINRPVAPALGYSAAEAAALGPYPFVHLCHPDDLPAALERDRRWRDVAEGEARPLEFRVRHRNGDWRWFVSYNTPFRRDAAGRVVQMLGISQDVTEQKRAEELLRRSERIESLGLLAGGVAHDFSNLLTPIVGHVERLLDRLPAAAPEAADARAIARAAERATELVRQLLVYAGRGEIARHPLDLNDVVADAVRLLELEAPGAPPLTLDLEPGLPEIEGDRNQLGQVVMNLLANARDAVAGGPGGIRVATRRVLLAGRELGAMVVAEGLDAGPAVLLEIADQGIGMDADTLARLWEPFFTTKGSGRGLGLPSVLGILRQHRAGLAVESRPGGGTRFRIAFATHAPAAT